MISFLTLITNLSHLDISELQKDVQEMMTNWKHNVLKIAFDQQTFIHEDYKEFVELCILFLIDQECQPHSVTFKCPGAMHKVRWMVKLLFSIKICLSEKQIELPKSTITS